MKKFATPTMTIQKLDPERVMTDSACFETFACTECYCSLVQCPDTYSCKGLVCDSLSDYN